MNLSLWSDESVMVGIACRYNSFNASKTGAN